MVTRDPPNMASTGQISKIKTKKINNHYVKGRITQYKRELESENTLLV
jgi:hypothetical protein